MSRRVKAPGRVVVPAPAPAAGRGPGDPLAQLVEHQGAIAAARELELQLILRCRAAGLSWRLIGAAAGVTAQAAEQRAARAERRAAG